MFKSAQSAFKLSLISCRWFDRANHKMMAKALSCFPFGLVVIVVHYPFELSLDFSLSKFHTRLSSSAHIKPLASSHNSLISASWTEHPLSTLFSDQQFCKSMRLRTVALKWIVESFTARSIQLKLLPCVCGADFRIRLFDSFFQMTVSNGNISHCPFKCKPDCYTHCTYRIAPIW